jgi:hypothetical protein
MVGISSSTATQLPIQLLIRDVGDGVIHRALDLERHFSFDAIRDFFCSSHTSGLQKLHQAFRENLIRETRL